MIILRGTGAMTRICLKLFLVMALATGFPLPSQAAEKIILKYSILRESVSIPELSQLSKTGEVSSSLQSYLNLANQKPEDLQRWLNQSFNIDPIVLSEVLNSFVGKYLLQQIAEVIHTPSQRSNIEALRGALISSATEDKNISLIEVLENYPTAELQVEGDRLMELYQQIKGLVGKIPRFPL
jgi:hypothetical protein